MQLGHRKSKAWAQDVERTLQRHSDERPSAIVRTPSFASLQRATDIYIRSKNFKTDSDRDARLNALISAQQTKSAPANALCTAGRLAHLACAHTWSDETWVVQRKAVLDKAHRRIDALPRGNTTPGMATAAIRDLDYEQAFLSLSNRTSADTLAALQALQQWLNAQPAGLDTVAAQAEVIAYLARSPLPADDSVRALLQAYAQWLDAAVAHALDAGLERIRRTPHDMDFLRETQTALRGRKLAFQTAWVEELLAWRPDDARVDAITGALRNLPEGLAFTAQTLTRALSLESPAFARRTAAEASDDERRALSHVCTLLLTSKTRVAAVLCNTPGGVQSQARVLDEVLPLLGENADLLADVVLAPGAEALVRVSDVQRIITGLHKNAAPEVATLFDAWWDHNGRAWTVAVETQVPAHQARAASLMRTLVSREYPQLYKAEAPPHIADADADAEFLWEAVKRFPGRAAMLTVACSLAKRDTTRVRRIVTFVENATDASLAALQALVDAPEQDKPAIRELAKICLDGNISPQQNILDVLTEATGNALPLGLHCPFANVVFADPVLGSDGITYERSEYAKLGKPCVDDPIIKRIVRVLATTACTLAEALDEAARRIVTGDRLQYPVLLADNHVYEQAFVNA